MSNLNIKNIHGGTLDALGLALIRGDYPPGSKLPPEQKLCEMLGVSRTILREAVKSLVAKGLISTGPKIGTIVQPAERWNWFDRDVVDWQSRIGFPAQLLDDLQELRAVIEPQAVRLACSRATAQEIADLEAAYHGMAQAVADGYDTDYIAHDYAFHFGLLRASHNQMFLQMGRALQGLLEHIFKITTRTPDRGIERSLPHHWEIIDAIRAGDAERAHAASVFQLGSSRADVSHALVATQRVRKPAAKAAGKPGVKAAKPSAKAAAKPGAKAGAKSGAKAAAKSAVASGAGARGSAKPPTRRKAA